MSGLPSPIVMGAAGGAAWLLYQALVEDGHMPARPPERGGGNVIEDRAKSWKATNTVGFGAANMVPGYTQAVYSPRPPTSGAPPVHGTVGDQEQIDRAEAEAFRIFEQKCADEYAKLEEDLRIKGATAINHVIPAGLSGHETWEEAQAKIGAGVGAMAGKLACSAIPIPGVNAVLAATACATLGAMIGAWLADKLGPKIKEWAERQWSKVKEFAEELWGDIKDAAGDAWDWADENIW